MTKIVGHRIVGHKIVGHRGAAGLALENTIPSFRMARKLGVDAIELDVQRTRDGEFVVCHDNNLERILNRPEKISNIDYAELSRIKLENGYGIPLLRDVLREIPGVPVVLDLKLNHHLEELCTLLDDYKNDFTFVTHLNKVVRECKRLRPNIPAFVGRHYSPLGLMRSIRTHQADGINLNYIWLNPLTYHAAKKLGLQIQVYTVNNVRVAQILKRLYPGIWICTDHPDKLISALREHKIA